MSKQPARGWLLQLWDGMYSATKDGQMSPVARKASGGWRCCLECVSLAAAPILLVSMIIVRLGKWLGTAKDGWTKQRVA
jgi:hypothetical protein